MHYEKKSKKLISVRTPVVTYEHSSRSETSNPLGFKNIVQDVQLKPSNANSSEYPQICLLRSKNHDPFSEHLPSFHPKISKSSDSISVLHRKQLKPEGKKFAILRTSPFKLEDKKDCETRLNTYQQVLHKIMERFGALKRFIPSHAQKNSVNNNFYA